MQAKKRGLIGQALQNHFLFDAAKKLEKEFNSTDAWYSPLVIFLQMCRDTLKYKNLKLQYSSLPENRWGMWNFWRQGLYERIKPQQRNKFRPTNRKMGNASVTLAFNPHGNARRAETSPKPKKFVDNPWSYSGVPFWTIFLGKDWSIWYAKGHGI